MTNMYIIATSQKPENQRSSYHIKPPLVLILEAWLLCADCLTPFGLN